MVRLIHASDLIITDTSTQNYFKTKTKINREEADDDFPQHLNNSMDIQQQPKTSSSLNHQEIRNSTDKDKFNDTRLAVNYRPLLTKTDSIDLDCKFEEENFNNCFFSSKP